MMRLHLIWIACFAIIASACGQTQIPQKPSVQRTSAGQQGSVNEFQAFLQQADLLQPEDEDMAEGFPALILQSQLRLMMANLSNGNTLSEGERGRCVLFAATSQIFVESDVQDPNILLSPGGRVAYTNSEDFQAGQCQSVFRESMKERFQQDFFQVHVSFFSFDF